MKIKLIPALALAATLFLSACGGKNADVPYELRTDDLPSAITLSVQWVDAKGFSVPTVMSRWDTTVVQARQTQRIFSIAPSPKAVKAFISFSYDD